MKRLLFLLLVMTGPLAARTPDCGDFRIIPIWNNATAPHSNELAAPETAPAPGRIGNVSEAELHLFAPDPAKATGLAVVVCPGGGYERLAIDHEGHDVARWLAANGITAAVLKYRMPDGHPEVPLEDAEQALRIMCGLEAGATGYTADKVGIMGFSAGGHLAAMVSTMATKCRPAFSILFYPVITAEKGLAHEGSFDNLLGRERNAELDARYSLENRVTPETPPALLFLSDDDGAVPPLNAVCYYGALNAHGIEASMHIYPSGEHGWGIRESFPYRECWQEALLDWLRQR